MPSDITATLARFSLTPADLLTAAPKAAQVGRYRGTAAGWIPAGGPRPAAEAARLITLWQRIDPAAPDTCGILPMTTDRLARFLA